MLNIYLIVLITLLFYLIGSFPTAFILLKFFHKKDITKEGTGNVGAMNSYEVSGSKKTGILVFAIDFLKGLVPAYFILEYFRISFEDAYIPLTALVIGHNFSVWLKYKGGRGLATAAGIFSVVNFWIVAIWCVIFLISQAVKKNVHIGNSLATILLPIVLLILNSQGLMFSAYSGAKFYNFIIFVSLVVIVIILKHIEPLKKIITKIEK